MRVIRLVEPERLVRAVATVGTFDGVHLGHASVVRSVLDETEKRDGTSVVVTFDPHPRQVIDGDNAPTLLTTLEEKQWRLAQLGIDVLAVVPFDRHLRKMLPEAFVEEFLVNRLGVQAIVVGYDHGFGRNRQGDFDTMRTLGRRLGFEAVSVPPTLVDGAPISSTRIRDTLARGDFETARELLGGGFPAWGRVVRGDGRGRTLGFPTANIDLNGRAKQLPKPGVYAGWAYLSQPHPVVLNFGMRPTFGGAKPSFEVHLLDFSGDLYGQMLKLDICHQIRQEQTFSDRDELIRQIQSDIQKAKTLLSKPKPITIWR